MNLSHFVEKLKVGKKFVLLDLIVHPDCQRSWDSAGPENKFIPTEVWKIIYKKIESLCRKQFAERNKTAESAKCEIDTKFECRLDGKPNYLLEFEFKDENFRTHLNVVFNDDLEKLHSECLIVHISDVSKELYHDLLEKTKTLEKLQKENEKLKELPVLSQEYTPVPVKKSSSQVNLSFEYIPTVINGGSPVQSSSYRARKIENSSIKLEPDPYTPTSSQENLPDQIAYIPSSSLATPIKKNLDSKPSVSTDHVNIGKRRRKEKAIFGSDDEGDEPSSYDFNPNRSDENLFSSPEAALANEENGDEIASLRDKKRFQLPRKVKTETIHSGSMNTEEKCPLTSSVTKRRRNDEESDSTGSSSKMPPKGWYGKSTRKKDETSHQAKIKESDKRSKAKSDKDGTTTAVPMRVDHAKLKMDEENMRKTIATLDQLDKMLPEDKTLLNIPILNCHDMSVDEILGTFKKHRRYLKEIYDRYKDKTERELCDSELCYFTQVTSVLSDDQTYAMIKCLEEFNPVDRRGMYVEFFSSTLVMEWGLHIWMDRHGYDDRKEALDRIKLQEEANPLDMTPSTIRSMMGNRSLKG